MRKKPQIFMSYCRKDRRRAVALEAALKARGLSVWRDERSLTAGLRFTDEIEDGIRRSRGVVVLITESSVSADWVTYEYAFATGAGVPIVATNLNSVRVPRPLQRFQIIPFSDAITVAHQVDRGISEQSRAAGLKRATSPVLVARFHEINGSPEFIQGSRPRSYWIDLWLEHVPALTTSVSYEIPDEGFRDRRWTVKRKQRPLGVIKEFRTKDMNTFGDVEIWAQGIGRGKGRWSGSWRLFEALVRYYHGRSTGKEIRTALQQIRDK